MDVFPIIGPEPDWGRISLHNENGKSLLDLRVFDLNGGLIAKDTFGQGNAELGGLPDSTGHGYGFLQLSSENGGSIFLEALGGEVSLRSQFGGTTVELKGADETGNITLRDTAGLPIAELFGSIDTSGLGHGVFHLNGKDGSGPKILMEADEEIGTTSFYGPSSLNITMGGVADFGTSIEKDWGKISLKNENNKATVDIKSFDEYGEINFLDTFGVVGASLGNLSDLSTGHGSGFLQLKSNDGSNSIYARGADGNGIISIYSDSTSHPDNIAIDLYAQSGNGNGAIQLYEKGDANSAKAIIEVDPTNGHGGAFFNGANESTNIFISGINDGTNGYISTNDQNGDQQARMYSNSFGAGAGTF